MNEAGRMRRRMIDTPACRSFGRLIFRTGNFVESMSHVLAAGQLGSLQVYFVA